MGFKVNQKIILSFLILNLSFIITSASDWTQYQYDSLSSGYFNVGLTFDQSKLNELTLDAGSDYQPLIGDILGDGDSEQQIVIFNGTSLLILNNDLDVIGNLDLGGNLLGQPTLYNINDDTNLEIIFNYNVSNQHNFTAYKFDGSFTQLVSINVSNNLTGSGIKCANLNGTKSCVFVDNFYYIHLVNMSDFTENSSERIATTSDTDEKIPSIADYDNDGKKEMVVWSRSNDGSKLGFAIYDLEPISEVTNRAERDTLFADTTYDRVGQPVFAQLDSGDMEIIFVLDSTQSWIIADTGSAFKWSENMGDVERFTPHTPLIIDCDNDDDNDVVYHTYATGALDPTVDHKVTFPKVK